MVVLRDLLAFWHGDRYTMGWASPTLAHEIAKITKPESVKELALKIYGTEDELPHEQHIRDCLTEGYARFKGPEALERWREQKWAKMNMAK